MLKAWGIVLILTGIISWYLIAINNSYIDNNELMISITSNSKMSNEYYQIPGGSTVGSYVNSENSFFPSGGKVKYNIIKDSKATFINSVQKTFSAIYSVVEIAGMKDDRLQYSVIKYNDDDDFGMPVDSTMIDYYSNKRHSYSTGFTHIDLPDKNSFACIDWVNPRWPKNGKGVDAVVSILVYVSSNGNKECKIMKEEYPVYGFGKALLEAINESIFWPAKDIYGNKLSGSYLITFEFCEECKENTVEILSGDLVIKPRRKL